MNPALGEKRLVGRVLLPLGGGSGLGLGGGSSGIQFLLLLLTVGFVCGSFLAEFLGFDLGKAGKGKEGREIAVHLRVFLVERGVDLLARGNNRSLGLGAEELEAIHGEASRGNLRGRSLFNTAGKGRRERKDGGEGSFVVGGLGLHGRRDMVQAAGSRGSSGQKTDSLTLHFDSLFLAELGQDKANAISIRDKGNGVCVSGDSLLVAEEGETMLVGTNEVNS